MNKTQTTSSTKTRSTKTRTKAVSQPVQEPEPVVETVVETVVEPVVETVTETEAVVMTEESIKQRLDRIIKARQDHILELKREIQELRKLQRDHEHALKDASKRSKKKRFKGTVLILESHLDLHQR